MTAMCIYCVQVGAYGSTPVVISFMYGIQSCTIPILWPPIASIGINESDKFIKGGIGRYE